MVVPQEHFIHWELRMRAAPHQSQNIAPKQHLDNANSSVELYEILVKKEALIGETNRV